MQELARAVKARLAIPVLAVAVAATIGCGPTNDLERAQSGAPLKTPTEVRREAEAQYGITEKPKPDTKAKPGAGASKAGAPTK